jgi:hypothetical protein
VDYVIVDCAFLYKKTCLSINIKEYNNKTIKLFSQFASLNNFVVKCKSNMFFLYLSHNYNLYIKTNKQQKQTDKANKKVKNIKQKTKHKVKENVKVKQDIIK